jgi:hypothetical protein
MSQDEFARIAWSHRNGKTYTPPRPLAETAETSSVLVEPSEAARRQEAEFELRRGEALKLSRRRRRLTPYKKFAVTLLGGELKP